MLSIHHGKLQIPAVGAHLSDAKVERGDDRRLKGCERKAGGVQHAHSGRGGGEQRADHLRGRQRDRPVVQLPQCSAQLPGSRMVRRRSRAYRHHAAAEALALRRLPRPASQAAVLISSSPKFLSLGRGICKSTLVEARLCSSSSSQDSMRGCATKRERPVPSSVQSNGQERQGGHYINDPFSHASVVNSRTLHMIRCRISLRFAFKMYMKGN